VIVPGHSLLKHYGVYYIQSPELVHKILDTNRYAQRWPLIPQNELHASSVQHPHYAGWRWLLHSRRVPLLEDVDGVSQPAASQSVGVSSSASSGDPHPTATLSPCAGIGDPAGLVWMCFDCMNDICAKKVKMPLNALANDNWIGRERVHVREASKGTKMLASLGRCCWKQVRLGRGPPDLQQKAISGNTIFFAQPTADIPSMELPPLQKRLLIRSILF